MQHASIMAVYAFLIVGDTYYCVILFFHLERKSGVGLERTYEVHQKLQDASTNSLGRYKNN